MRKKIKFPLFSFVLVLAIFLSLFFVKKEYFPRQVSAFGLYSGYSKKQYDTFKRFSQYVTMKDGTKLAVDIFRPMDGSQVVNVPLPVIWTHDRYHRADKRGDRILTQLESEPWLKEFILYGYVVAVVDARGTGASFGIRNGPFSNEEMEDAYQITEWLAHQQWSSGKIGMFGASYMGITQYLAASQQPPSLKAIFPQMALFDLYEFTYPGGLFRQDYVKNWSESVEKLDLSTTTIPVDEDQTRAALRAAISMHQSNRNVFEMFRALPCRNAVDSLTGSMPYLEVNPASKLEEINKSGVAIYHLAGWWDMWPKDALLWFNNLENPQKMVIGPWPHMISSMKEWKFDVLAEYLRWFDYWLKGIDNGIMEEPPITFYTLGDYEDQAWRQADTWPLPQSKNQKFYFQPNIQATPKIKGGKLSSDSPKEEQLPIEYIPDYTCSSSEGSRWANGYGQKFYYPDMNMNDEKGISFTGAPLSTALELTGHPVVRLWVETKSEDESFFVYLEDVDKAQRSHYITEGVLRMSARQTQQATFNHLGLPWHSGICPNKSDKVEEAVELVFDLIPTSYIFDEGHSIRVTITCADTANFGKQMRNTTDSILLYCDAAHPSSIDLPIVDPTLPSKLSH